MESMKDFEAELEASYKVMGDGEKDTDSLIAWGKIKELYEAGEIINVTVSGILSREVVALVEGIRGIIPASRLSLQKIDDLNDWLGKEVRVRIITADQDAGRLVMSAKEILKEERDNAKRLKIADIKVGSVLEGKVDSLQTYGAFIDLGEHVSGLVHISQIALKRIKHPSDVLKEGNQVTVKVIGNKDGKLSLSIKALLEEKQEKEYHVEIPESEEIGTSMGDLLKNLKL